MSVVTLKDPPPRSVTTSMPDYLPLRSICYDVYGRPLGLPLPGTEYLQVAVQVTQLLLGCGR